MVHRLVDQYGNRIKFVFRHFPLPMHQYAVEGAEADEAAGEQGKFWEMVDALFAHGGAINDQVIENTARQLGLDMNRFDQSMKNHDHASIIRADIEEGRQRGINATPHFDIGQAAINGLPSWDQLDAVVREELAKVQ